MNDATIAQPYNQIHQVIVQSVDVHHFADLRHCEAFDQFHDDAVPIEIDRFRHGKASIVQRRHVGKFTCGRNAGQIQPRRFVPSSVIVALLFDVPETCAAQAMQFQAQRHAVVVADRVNVRLFSDANLIAKRGNRFAQR